YYWRSKLDKSQKRLLSNDRFFNTSLSYSLLTPYFCPWKLDENYCLFTLKDNRHKIQHKMHTNHNNLGILSLNMLHKLKWGTTTKTSGQTFSTHELTALSQKTTTTTNYPKHKFYLNKLWQILPLCPLPCFETVYTITFSMEKLSWKSLKIEKSVDSALVERAYHNATVKKPEPSPIQNPTLTLNPSTARLKKTRPEA
uniref:Uncharacterized protein n=1 Tax=Romanomermis culicivorax TaxID=13658 RepID=A0A915KTA3_ROMCU